MADPITSWAAGATIFATLQQTVTFIQDQVKAAPEPAAVTLPPISLPEDRPVIGRAADLKRLYTQMAMSTQAVITSKGAVLQGEGGYGKTTLARHYAEDSRKRYSGGCWINAETRDGRAQMFSDIMAFGAAAFNLPVPEPITEAHVKAVVAAVAACGAKLLFIYDNVDDFAAVRPFMPEGAAVDIIVTTREAEAIPGFATFALDVLDTDGPDSAAVNLLLQEAGHPLADTETRAAAQGLAEDLGGLPLALVIAGALVKRGESIADLRADLRHIIETEPSRVGAYRDSLSAAVKLSYSRLSADARGVVDVLAWWAAEGLEPRLFFDAPAGAWWEQSRDDIPKRWHGFLQDPARVRGAFADLRGLSMLRAEAATGPHRLHRMTAVALRLHQGARALDVARAAAVLLKAVYPGGAHDPANWPACRRLTPHALALWATAEPLWRAQWRQPGWAAMDLLLNQCGVYLSRQGDQAEGLAAKEASLRLKEARLGEAAWDIPLALGNLGVTLADMGQFEVAQARLDRALALDEAHRPESAEMAARYLQRAILEVRRAEAKATADLDQAEHWIEAAQALRDRLFGAESEAVASCWNILGYLRDLQGRGAEAAALYERAWTIRRGLPQPNRATLAGSAINTGASWLEAGAAARAEPPLREALEICEEIYVERPEHAERRKAADWMISCLYTLARAGNDPQARRAEAAALCRTYGFDPAAREAHAPQYPTTPPEAP